MKVKYGLIIEIPIEKVDKLYKEGGETFLLSLLGKYVTTTLRIDEYFVVEDKKRQRAEVYMEIVDDELNYITTLFRENKPLFYKEVN